MPRCKNCKEKFEPLRFNQKYCFKDECVKVWVSAGKKILQKQDRKRRAKIKESLKTVKDYHKDAQRTFNTYVRLRDNGKECISCSLILDSAKRKFDAGHFYSQGGHGSIRYDLDNCFAQCVPCNRHLHGNIHEYRKKLINRIGQERFNALEQKSNDYKKWTIEELKEIINEYKKKIKRLKNRP